MKQKLFSVLLLLLALNASAQFEQKASLNFSAGIFKTLGSKTIESVPLQMPWYKPGISADAGFQYNLSKNFSLVAEIGVLYSSKWNCIIDGYDWMTYEVWQDTVTILSSGLNEMSLINFSLAVKPKIYLIPESKLRPFIFAGLSINYTKAPFKDRYWDDCIRFGLNDPGDESPWPYLQKNIGLGINPGFGFEYAPADKIAFWLASGINLILMNENNFPYDSRDDIRSHLTAFHVNAGFRFNILKSKDI